jgi:hypothetical protein
MQTQTLWHKYRPKSEGVLFPVPLESCWVSQDSHLDYGERVLLWN